MGITLCSKHRQGLFSVCEHLARARAEWRRPPAFVEYLIDVVGHDRPEDRVISLWLCDGCAAEGPWGPRGAAVIETTEEQIERAAAWARSLLCVGCVGGWLIEHAAPGSPQHVRMHPPIGPG